MGKARLRLGTHRRGEEVEIPAARAALGMFWAKKGLVAPTELLDIGMSRLGLRKYLDEERRRQHVERASWRIVGIYRFRRERVRPRSGQRYRQRRCFKGEDSYGIWSINDDGFLFSRHRNGPPRLLGPISQWDDVNSSSRNARDPPSRAGSE